MPPQREILGIIHWPIATYRYDWLDLHHECMSVIRRLAGA